MNPQPSDVGTLKICPIRHYNRHIACGLGGVREVMGVSAMSIIERITSIHHKCMTGRLKSVAIP